MVQDLNVKEFLQRGLDLLDARVTKFKHFARIGEDDMVVLLDAETLLVLRHLIAKLVLANEVAINQQINRVVERSAADAVALC